MKTLLETVLIKVESRLHMIMIGIQFHPQVDMEYKKVFEFITK